jgi:hypothetical protein
MPRFQLSKVDAIVKSLKPDQIKLFHDMSTRVKTLEVSSRVALETTVLRSR